MSAGPERASRPEQAAHEPSRAMKAAPPDGDTLAAIEQFLARTRDYAEPDSDGAHARPRPSARKPRALQAGGATEAPEHRVPHVAEAAIRPGNANTAARVGSDRSDSTSHDSEAGQRQPQWINVGRIPDPARTSAATRPEPAPTTTVTGPSLPVLRSMSVTASPRSARTTAGRRGHANVPVDVVSSAPVVTWDTVIESLRTQPDATTNIGTIWQLGLAELASRPAEPPRPSIEGHPAETEALLSSFWAAAGAVRDLLLDPMGAGASAQSKVEQLARAVGQHVDPKIEHIQLCRRVTTYGVYEEMHRGDLVAGRPAQTIVYCELENLHAQEVPEGGYQTRLSTRMQLLTPEGEAVWSREEPQIVDRCRRRRRDFFLAQRVTLPGTLPAGEYVLKVTIEDLLAHRTAESTHNLGISSELALARQGRDGS